MEWLCGPWLSTHPQPGVCPWDALGCASLSSWCCNPAWEPGGDNGIPSEMHSQPKLKPEGAPTQQLQPVAQDDKYSVSIIPTGNTREARELEISFDFWVFF